MKNPKIRQRLYYLFIISILAIISLLSPSCDKVEELTDEINEYEVSIEELTEVVKTEADLNLAYLDVLNVGMRAGAFVDNTISNSIPAKKSSTENVLGGQMTLKFVGTSANPFPVFIQADWGETNKLGDDGKKRRGGLLLEFDGLWGVAGSTVKIYFGISEGDNVIREAFYLNDNRIEGVLTIYNNGDNSYSMNLTDGLFTYSDGRIAERNSYITLNWLEGLETKMDVSDDSWELNGGVEGITPSGVNYSVVVNPLEAVKKLASCEFPVSGVTQITIKKIKFALDYSFENEECDSKAMIEFFGINQEIDFIN